MNDIDTPAIRAAAAEATAGEWYADGCVIWHEIVVQGLYGEPEPAQEQLAQSGEADARFISLANPQTVTALLDQLDAAKARAQAAERELRSRAETEALRLDGGVVHDGVWRPDPPTQDALGHHGPKDRDRT